ncbi:MAG: hypothetical protein KAS99_02475 [Candidatus Omnitrophica bacterium]|nr:hypothetical protein [Candidatus Omnitrophota bacterium]
MGYGAANMHLSLLSCPAGKIFVVKLKGITEASGNIQKLFWQANGDM